MKLVSHRNLFLRVLEVGYPGLRHRHIWCQVTIHITALYIVSDVTVFPQGKDKDAKFVNQNLRIKWKYNGNLTWSFGPKR